MRYKTKFLVLLSCAFLLTACGQKEESIVDEKDEVTSISIVEKDYDEPFFVGDTFEVSVTDQNGNPLDDVTWTVEDSKIVSIEDGVVTALAVGETTISAKYETFTDTLDVKVDEKTFDVMLSELNDLTYLESSGTYAETYYVSGTEEVYGYTQTEVKTLTSDTYLYCRDYDDTGFYINYDVTLKGDGIYSGTLGIDNKVSETLLTDESFSENDFENVFKTLTVNDFEAKEDGSYDLITEGKEETFLSQLGFNLTGHAFTVSSLTLLIDGGEISGFNVASIATPYSIYGENYDIVSTYEATFKKDRTKEEIGLFPHEKVKEHDELEAAFGELKTSSYTVNGVDHDPTGAYDDAQYKIVVADDGYYISDGLSQDIGFIEKEGKLHIYELVDGVPYGTSEGVEGTLEDVLPTFEVAPEIFTYVGEGVFVLDTDVSNYVNALKAISPDLATQTYPFASPGTVAVTLKDGHLSTLEFSYNMMGYIAGEVTYTYSAIGTSELPFDVSIFVEYVAPTSWEEYDPEVAQGIEDFTGVSADMVPFYLPAGGYMNGLQEYADYVYLETMVDELGSETVYFNEYCDLLEESGFTLIDSESTYYEEIAYYEKDGFEIGCSCDAGFGFFSIFIYGYPKAASLLPTSTWDVLDPELASELDNLVGDADLIPCIDVGSDYSLMGGIYLTAPYSDTISDSDLRATVESELTRIGYTYMVDDYGAIYATYENVTLTIEAGYGNLMYMIEVA